MPDNVSRTTISIDPEIMKAGLARAKALRYKTFSAYVQHLIETDARERPEHVQIRRESPPPLRTIRYGETAETLRVADMEADDVALAMKRQQQKAEPPNEETTE